MSKKRMMRCRKAGGPGSERSPIIFGEGHRDTSLVTARPQARPAIPAIPDPGAKYAAVVKATKTRRKKGQ